MGSCKILFYFFSNQLSLTKIKQNLKLSKKSYFQYVSEGNAGKCVKKCPSEKAITGETLVNVLKNTKI